MNVRFNNAVNDPRFKNVDHFGVATNGSEFGYFVDASKNYKRTIITAPTGTCAVYQDSNNVKEFYYVHTDYQGSWLAITNSNKAVTNRYSYDAWGRPRNVNDWTLKSVGITSALTNLNSFQPRFDRGYTGHEIMAGFGLINMNGRLYDPYLQRFLSPDPFVQAPNNSQSYNRYSYCMNNPLMYTDPSGYSWLGDRWKWAQRNAVPIAGIAAITAAAVLTCGGASILLAGAISGGIGGGLATGLQGGSLGQIAKSAAIGGAIGGFCGVLGGAMIGSGASMTGATAFTSTFGNGLSAMVSGSTDAPKVSLGGASVDLNNWKVRTMFGKGTNAADDIGYGLGMFGNFSDAMKLVNPQNDPGTLHTKATGTDGITDPGHSSWVGGNDGNKDNVISFGPFDSDRPMPEKLFDTPSTGNYKIEDGMPQLDVSLNSNVVASIHGWASSGFYGAAYGLQCSNATSLAALLSGHFMPNMALLMFNAPQMTYYSLLYEQQLQTTTVIMNSINR